MLSDQLASLTLGDAGAAAILERAPEGAPGIEVAGFTTLSEHSRLCLAFPAKIGPGATMYTKPGSSRRSGSRTRSRCCARRSIRPGSSSTRSTT